MRKNMIPYKFGLKTPRIVECIECGKEFATYNNSTKYCSKKCMNRAFNRKKQEMGYRRSYYLKHPQKMRKYSKDWRQKMQRLWYNGHDMKYINHQDKIVRQSEEVARDILTKHGFTDILHTREFSSYFPCDYLARRNGRICAVEVTLGITRNINLRIDPLLEFFDMNLHCLHIRPDFSFTYLKRVKKGTHYSSCASEFVRWLNGKA